MPNLLAHFAFQGPASHGVIRAADPRWIVLGCLLPDVPWIIQRAARALAPAVDAYDLRIYAVIQASLLFSFLLALGVTAVARDGRKVLAILLLGCALHLLADALQTKWANGVHFLAPFSWRLQNFGLFWPESVVSYLLTVAGLAYVGWALRRLWDTAVPVLELGGRRVATFAAVLAAYLVLPFAFMGTVEAENNHFVGTLRDRDERTGQYVEFDRNRYLQRDGETLLRTFAGEELALRGEDLGEPGTVSVRGRFVDEKTVQVTGIHHHAAGFRLAASYVGLLIIAALWLLPALRRSAGR